MFDNLGQHLFKLERDQVFQVTREALDSGENPVALIEAGQKGMARIGEKFQQGDFFLAELMLAAQIFKTMVEMITPHLKQATAQTNTGRVLLATPQGDIHDLGKGIVAVMLQARGVEVLDLGTDVSTEEIVAQAMEFKPQIVGLSCLLTTVFNNMRRTVDALEEAGLSHEIKLVIGGGVTDESTREFVGADYQTTDVIDGVNYCMRIMEGE